MSEPIFFSIVIAVRNGAKFIAETLESILNQTYRYFELIVVDDGSTDQTVDIVNQYIKHDNRLRLIYNSNEPGASQARNCGISHAKGSWIANCDGDDVWKIEKLQIQADFIYNWQGDKPLVALGTSGYTINEAGKVISRFTSYPNTIKEFNEYRSTYEPFIGFLHSSMVFNKEAFHQVGEYLDDYIPAEDSDLFTRLSDIGVILNIDQPLTLYRKHLGSFQLNTTIRQINSLDLIKQNTYRRRSGMKELTYEEFVKQRSTTMTEVEKKALFRKQKGKYLYRVGAINLANGRSISGIAHLLFAMFYDRPLVLSNLKRVVVERLI